MKFVASYLIALFNKEDYISACVKSILDEQTSEIDIEIIVVDDGSTDKSYQVALELSRRFKCIKLYSFKKNRGFTIQ